MGTGGFLRLNPTFAYAKASFLMTFAMGGVPHAGSWLKVNPAAALEELEDLDEARMKE